MKRCDIYKMLKNVLALVICVLREFIFMIAVLAAIVIPITISVYLCEVVFSFGPLESLLVTLFVILIIAIAFEDM